MARDIRSWYRNAKPRNQWTSAARSARRSTSSTRAGSSQVVSPSSAPTAGTCSRSASARTRTSVSRDAARRRPVAAPPPSPRRRVEAEAADAAATMSAARAEATRRSASRLAVGTDRRQWLVRLENGETKTCRELATLQQWIVAGVVARESLISRSGKTWKRLGDIAELGQYFVDCRRGEGAARGQADRAGEGVPARRRCSAWAEPPADGTRTIESRTTGNFRARARRRRRRRAKPNPIAQTELAPSGPVADDARRRRSRPPPPAVNRSPRPPGRGRHTAAWANNEVKASESMAAMPQGPRGGKLPQVPRRAGVRRQDSRDARRAMLVVRRPQSRRSTTTTMSDQRRAARAPACGSRSSRCS